jgi:hypothetical protein
MVYQNWPVRQVRNVNRHYPVCQDSYAASGQRLARVGAGPLHAIPCVHTRCDDDHELRMTRLP